MLGKIYIGGGGEELLQGFPDKIRCLLNCHVFEEWGGGEKDLVNTYFQDKIHK